MNTLKLYLTSSIGKKVTMAATGLFLIVFLLEHLYGNLLLYFDLFIKNEHGEAFIEYSHSAVRNILIRLIEIFLFAAIIIHVIQALIITMDNRKARPIKYAAPSTSGGSNWINRNMGITGSIILFFIVVHLYNFFLPYRITSMPNGMNLAQLVKAGFQNPYYVALYVISVTFLSFHLSHGFRSAFHTLGLNNKKYTPVWKMAANGFAVFIWLGFAPFPILFYFGIAGTSF